MSHSWHNFLTYTPAPGNLTLAGGTRASFKPCSPVSWAAVVQVGVIPARYKSGRFPGKPLVDIMGKPMVVRTWEQACKARTLDAVVVATDDDRIADVCRRAGARVVMTSEDCANGKSCASGALRGLPSHGHICFADSRIVQSTPVCGARIYCISGVAAASQRCSALRMPVLSDSAFTYLGKLGQVVLSG